MLLSDVMKGIQYKGNLPDREVTDLTSDSRKVTDGVVFVCIKGIKSDGHDFAEKAASSGAAAIVCDRDLGLANQMIVGSTREAFAAMCENFMGHPLSRLKLIGVTAEDWSVLRELPALEAVYVDYESAKPVLELLGDTAVDIIVK